MSFFNKIVNESPPTKRKIIFNSVEVSFDIASIIESSKDTSCADIEPTDDKTFVTNNIFDLSSLSIPTKDSYDEFISWEIGSYLDDNIDNTVYDKIKNNIMNLIITIAIKNVNFLLNFYKSNDNQPEKEPMQNVENH